VVEALVRDAGVGENAMNGLSSEEMLETAKTDWEKGPAVELCDSSMPDVGWGIPNSVYSQSI